MSPAVKPLSPAIGAEVSGIDLRRIGGSDAETLRQAWLEPHVVVVHGQELSEDELVAFGACFGRIERARKLSPLASRQEIMVISNIRRDGAALGQLPDGELSWHFDRIHQKLPNKAGVLYAVGFPRAAARRASPACAARTRRYPRRRKESSPG